MTETRNTPAPAAVVLDFCVLRFGFVSDFEFRISDLDDTGPHAV
jgi:hypothetical protein